MRIYQCDFPFVISLYLCLQESKMRNRVVSRMNIGSITVKIRFFKFVIDIRVQKRRYWAYESPVPAFLYEDDDSVFG